MTTYTLGPYRICITQRQGLSCHVWEIRKGDVKIGGLLHPPTLDMCDDEAHRFKNRNKPILERHQPVKTMSFVEATSRIIMGKKRYAQ